MSGFFTAYSACYLCNEPFGFNPMKVPSIVTSAGVKEPLCQTCVDYVNPLRIKKGLEPIVPLPGAYEPCPEEEMVWP